jgi:hypothetical protein
MFIWSFVKVFWYKILIYTVIFRWFSVNISLAELHILLEFKIMKNINKIAAAVIAIGLLVFSFGVSTKTHASSVISEDGLADYAGNYTFKEGSPIPSVEVKVVKDKLVSTAPDGSEFTLEKDKEKADTFTIAELGATVTFTRNADKKVTGMKVSMDDGDLVADKDKEKEVKKP